MGQMASNLGNKDVMDPNQAKWGDLSGGEQAARVGGGAAKGLLGGVQGYENQNAQMRPSGGGGMAPAPQATPVSPDYFAPQAPVRKPINNNFYGGGQ